MLIITNDLISRKSNSNIIKFIVMTVIFTIFEYLVSAIFEWIFGIRWWDYTNEFLNLNGRICLAFSLLWGIGGIIFIKFCENPLQHLIEKVRKKVNEKTISIILSIFIIGTLVDFTLSIIKYIK